MTYIKQPSEAATNAIVPPQYTYHPDAASVNAIVSPQYHSFPSGAVAVDGPDVILGANLILRCRADVGSVSSWTDGVGGFHFVQAVAGNQPTITAAGGPNSTPTYLYNGVDQFMVSPIDLPGPGTTPVYIWMIFRQVTWTSGRRLWNSGTASRMHGLQTAATPNLRTGDAVNYDNAGAAINTYVRGEILFTNSAADYFKLAATETTGAGMSNSNPAAGFTIGADNAGANFGNIEIAEILIANIAPSAGQRTALDAYCTSRYGAGLV